MEEKRKAEKGEAAGGVLHYILLKQQHIVQVGMMPSTPVLVKARVTGSVSELFKSFQKKLNPEAPLITH